MIEKYATRDLWMERRQKVNGIGASEAAAVLGANPFVTALEVYANKRSQADERQMPEAVEWGTRLEGPILDGYQERSGRELNRGFFFAQSPDHPWLCASPDALQDEGAAVVEVKNVGARMAEQWADEPPLYYQIQVQHQMAATGLEHGTLVALIGGQKLVWFDVERNHKFIAVLVERLAAFWECVESGTPPAVVDGSESTRRALKLLHPKDNGETVALPQSVAIASEHLEIIEGHLKEMEQQRDQCRAKLMAAIGDATYGVLPDGSMWSWKHSTRKGYTVKESETRTLRRIKSNGNRIGRAADESKEHVAIGNDGGEVQP